MSGRAWLVTVPAIVLVGASLSCVAFAEGPACRDEDISRFPAYGVQEIARGLEARFELRRCGDIGIVRVLMFERGARKPAVELPLQDTWPALYHHRNVLVVQAPGGTSSVVRVFWFRRGKAQAAVEEETQGSFRAQVEEDKRVVVVVPRHRARAPERRLTFPLEFTLWQGRE